MSYKYVKYVIDIVLPNHRLSDYEIENAARKLGIPNFRRVFMRNRLPRRPWNNECGILNLDVSSGTGTHWMCWVKSQNKKISFYSYGHPLPEELVKYLQSPVYYNSECIQPDSEVFCGHLCLFVLKKQSEDVGFQENINTLF